MELIVDEEGAVAPRLNDMELSPETAKRYHDELITQTVRMLCSGIIHGDLSEFNILVDARGPVIIDLPQAVNAAGNNNAEMMFARDVDNLRRHFGRFEPAILELMYAKEIWSLYEQGLLRPETKLTGKYVESSAIIDVGGVLEAIGDAQREHEEKLSRRVSVQVPGGGERPPLHWNPRDADLPQDARRSADPMRSMDRPKSRGAMSVPVPPVVPQAKAAPSEPAPPAKMQWGRRPSGVRRG